MKKGNFVKYYYVGGRQLGAWVLALSVAGTAISGGTFTGASTTGNGTFTVASVPTTSTLTLTNLNCSSTTNNGGLVLSNSNLGIVAYTNVGPSATNIRDRLRAIVHFILTSPDYTIQR